MSTYIYSQTTRKARDINGYKSIIYISVSNLGLEKSTKLYFIFQTLGKVITSTLVLGLDSWASPAVPTSLHWHDSTCHTLTTSNMTRTPHHSTCIETLSFQEPTLGPHLLHRTPPWWSPASRDSSRQLSTLTRTTCRNQLSLSIMGPRDPTEIIKLGSRCLSRLNHLSGLLGTVLHGT